jgi:hypothetical protein
MDQCYVLILFFIHQSTEPLFVIVKDAPKAVPHAPARRWPCAWNRAPQLVPAFTKHRIRIDRPNAIKALSVSGLTHLYAA